MHDLLAGALIQSANNAADALASAASNGDVPRFVGWMNARARELGLSDTHFVRPDGLDAPGHVSSARDVARACAGGDALADRARARAPAKRHDRGWDVRRAHLERPARRLSRPDRRQDRPHERRRLVRGRGRAAFRLHDLCGDPRQPDAGARNADLAGAARVGRLAVPHAAARRCAAVRVGGAAVRRRADRARRAQAARAGGSRRAAGRREDRRADRRHAAGRARSAARPDRGLGRRKAARDPSAACRALRFAAGARRTATVVLDPHRAQPAGLLP